MTEPEQTDALLDLIERALDPEDFPTATEPGGDVEEEAQREAWKIDGERTALWALTRYRRALANVVEAERTAEALVEAGRAHVRTVEQREDATIRYFSAKLRQYHEEQINGTRRKSTPLPGATLKTRAGSVKCILPDDKTDERAALVAWLEDHNPDAIEYLDPAVKKAPLTERYAGKVDATEPGAYLAVDADTGEIVPGVKFERGEPVFSITLGDVLPETE